MNDGDTRPQHHHLLEALTSSASVRASVRRQLQRPTRSRPSDVEDLQSVNVPPPEDCVDCFEAPENGTSLESTQELWGKWYLKLQLQLAAVELMAYVTHILYKINWFLGLCSLTWATTVVLGGVVSNLRTHDYYTVSALLFLQAVATSTTAARLHTLFNTWTRATRRAVLNMDKTTYIFWSSTTHLKGLFRILDLAFQLILLAALFGLAGLRFHRLQRYRFLCDTTASDADTCDHITLTSLFIFYSLILCNASVAFVAIIFNKIVVLAILDRFSSTSALHKYYDKLIRKAFDDGMLKMSGIHTFHHFCIHVLEQEYSTPWPDFYRPPSHIRDHYRGIVKYLYIAPPHKGADVVTALLLSRQVREKVLGARIVWCWVDILGGKRLVCLVGANRKLFSALVVLAEMEMEGARTAMTGDFIALRGIHKLVMKTEGKVAEMIFSEKKGLPSTRTLPEIVTEKLRHWPAVKLAEDDNVDNESADQMAKALLIGVWIHLLPVISPEQIYGVYEYLMSIVKDPKARDVVKIPAAYAALRISATDGLSDLSIEDVNFIKDQIACAEVQLVPLRAYLIDLLTELFKYNERYLRDIMRCRSRSDQGYSTEGQIYVYADGRMMSGVAGDEEDDDYYDKDQLPWIARTKTVFVVAIVLIISIVLVLVATSWKSITSSSSS